MYFEEKVSIFPLPIISLCFSINERHRLSVRTNMAVFRNSAAHSQKNSCVGKTRNRTGVSLLNCQLA